MTKYAFVIDQRKCIGCHACTVACKAEHDVPIGVYRADRYPSNLLILLKTAGVSSLRKAKRSGDRPQTQSYTELFNPAYLRVPQHLGIELHEPQAIGCGKAEAYESVDPVVHVGEAALKRGREASGRSTPMEERGLR